MIVPVTITTPDGVERALRFTLGARRRISRDLAKPFADVMSTLTDEDLPTFLYHCLFDEDGNPPAGLSITKLEESYEPSDTKALLADLISAMSQGNVKKNEALTMIDQLSRRTTIPTGSPSGDSPVSISESPAASPVVSGSKGNSGNSRRKNTPLSVMPTTNGTGLSSPVSA